MTASAGRFRALLACLLMGAFTLAFLPIQLAAIRFGRPDPGLVPHLFHRAARHALGLRIAVQGTPDPVRPLLIVANHASWIDIVVLSSLVPGARFVARADMASWPGIGLLARLHRTIFVERTRRTSTGRQAKGLAEALSEGGCVVLFPEGTTNDGNRVLPFNSSLLGAVRQAAAADGTLRVQPVSIAYTRLQGMPMGRIWRPQAAWIGDQDLVPHLMQRLRGGALDATVIFHRSRTVSAKADRKALTRDLQAEIAAGLEGALADSRLGRGEIASPERISAVHPGHETLNRAP